LRRDLNLSFVPDLNAWESWRPDEVAEKLDSLPVLWAVAGGWAIDLYLGRVTRPHHDIEIAVGRNDMPAVQARLDELEWFAVGDGLAWPISDAPQELHQTWGRDASGRWRLDVFGETWDDGDWIFRRDPRIRRPLADVIDRTADGIPYLAPEVALLFKANAPRPKDEADFVRSLPVLTPIRITWLRSALGMAYPEHQWLSQLSTAG
jgi:hypothetical protein